MTITSVEMTLSSLQIADVVQSRHDNVKVCIERLEKSKTIQPSTATQEKGTGGRPSTVYHVLERDIDNMLKSLPNPKMDGAYEGTYKDAGKGGHFGSST